MLESRVRIPLNARIFALCILCVLCRADHSFIRVLPCVCVCVCLCRLESSTTQRRTPESSAAPHQKELQSNRSAEEKVVTDRCGRGICREGVTKTEKFLR